MRRRMRCVVSIDACVAACVRWHLHRTKCVTFNFIHIARTKFCDNFSQSVLFLLVLDADVLQKYFILKAFVSETSVWSKWWSWVKLSLFVATRRAKSSKQITDCIMSIVHIFFQNNMQLRNPKTLSRFKNYSHLSSSIISKFRQHILYDEIWKIRCPERRIVNHASTHALIETTQRMRWRMRLRRSGVWLFMWKRLPEVSASQVSFDRT